MGYPAFNLKFVAILPVDIHSSPWRVVRVVHHLDPAAEAFPEAEGFESRKREVVGHPVKRFFHCALKCFECLARRITLMNLE